MLLWICNHLHKPDRGVVQLADNWRNAEYGLPDVSQGIDTAQGRASDRIASEQRVRRAWHILTASPSVIPAIIVIVIMSLTEICGWCMPEFCAVHMPLKAREVV